GRRVRPKPLRPFLSRVFRVSAAHVKLQSRLTCALSTLACRGAGASRWPPPLDPAPLRKEFRVERLRLKRAFRLVLGAKRKHLAGIRGAQKYLPARRARNPRDLRRTRFRQLR